MPPRRACDLCYKRKIQCLIKTPGDPCDWCSNQEVACTFERVIPKNPNKRTTSDVVQELSSRVEELEDALKNVQQRPSAVPSPHFEIPPARSSNASTPYNVTSPQSRTASTDEPPMRSLSTLALHTATSAAAQEAQLKPFYKLSRCQLGNSWFFKGVGILSLRGQEWISDGSGERIFLDKFEIFGNPTGPRQHAMPTMPTQSLVLPPEYTSRYLVNVFFASKTSVVFPILDRSLLEQTIAKAYGTEPSDPASRASAEACLWAMFALVGFTKEAQEIDTIPEASECARQAKRLLFMLDGSVYLDILQATMLLWVYRKMKGQCREASVAFASACRLICDLGGQFRLYKLTLLPQHVPILGEPSKSHIRKLFWLCYCFDKDTCFRTASPPLLAHDWCEVDDPEEWSNSTAWYNQSRDVYLARVKEKASQLLGSPQAFKYTEGELLSHVRQLDDDLEEWRLAIEPPYRPKLSVSSDSFNSLSSTMPAEKRPHAINLQLDYLFTMIHIHTMVRRCGDLERNLPDDLHSVVHSSADLSIEASRSIFRFLDTVVDFWQEESVWVVSHYVPMAAMPLFMNILIHPLGNPADDDLQILASAGRIARKIPTERLGVEEIEQIQQTGEFVMELIRLCHSAAWKAKKGEREHDLDIIHA